MQDQFEDLMIVGRISGLFGVKGWIKIFSYTDPRENIVHYNPWLIKTENGWREVKVDQGQRHGKGVIAKLESCDDRDAASKLIGSDIALRKEQLPTLEKDEYYWTDLEGLKVITIEGQELGQVDHLIETGANDVLVVKGDRERLIPYIREQVVTRIDLENGIIEVDWDPEF
jgi:16S rRNA processing protein RimM